MGWSYNAQVPRASCVEVQGRLTLKWSIFLSSAMAMLSEFSSWYASGMSRCAGRMNSRAKMRCSRISSRSLSAADCPNAQLCSFVMMYFSSPCPNDTHPRMRLAHLQSTCKGRTSLSSEIQWDSMPRCQTFVRLSAVQTYLQSL